MRLLHASDLHLPATGEMGDRLAEQAASLEAFVDDALELEADALIVAGDVFDTRAPGPRPIKAFADFLHRVSSLGIPTIVTPGNHDGPEAIHEHEGKTTAWLRALELPFVHAFTVPEVVDLPTASGPLAVAVVPFPHKRSFDAQHERLSADQASTIAERTAVVGARTETMIREMQAALPKGMPSVCVGHLSTTGVSLGKGAAMQLGWDVTVDPQVFAGFDYAALGHIHVQQQVAPNAWYCGPMIRLGWDDADKGVGWLLADISRGMMPQVTPRPNPAARRLVLAGANERVDVHDAYCKIVYDEQVPAATLRATEKSLKAIGAYWVRAVSKPKPRGRRSAVAIDPAKTTEEHLRSWFKATGVEAQHAEAAIAVARDLE